MRTLATLLLALAGLALPARGDVGAVLEQMHAAGEGMTSLRARVTLTDFDFTTFDESIRPGTLTVRRGESPAVHVLFTGRGTPDGPFRPEKLEYLLKDGLLVDRNHRSKTEVRRRLPPEEAGRDLLALGEGPFPLPIGQDPERVRQLFDVAEVDAAGDNELEIPPVDGTVRLRLVPRPGTRFADEFERVVVDVDPGTGMPRQVSTLDAAEVNLRIVQLREPERNAPLGEDEPSLTDVDLSDGWNVTVEDLAKE